MSNGICVCMAEVGNIYRTNIKKITLERKVIKTKRTNFCDLGAGNTANKAKVFPKTSESSLSGSL